MPAIVPTSTNHIIDLTLEEGEMRRLEEGGSFRVPK